MTMNHVILINKRQFEVKRISGKAIVAGTGKQYMNIFPAEKKVIVKHAITGKFMFLKVKI